MLWTTAALVSSYLIGSIPTAYLFVRFLKGADIRKVGSGNVGATNALRVLGKGPGVLVLLLDIFKGFAAVVFLGNYFVNKPGFLEGHNLLILMGLCCICGHNWTIFLQFKGGKGIATSFGVLLALSIQIHGLNIVMGLIILVWLIVFIASRIVSLSSIISAIALPFFCFLFKQPKPVLYLSLLLSAFVIIRHKANLYRLFRGQEPRLNFKNKPIK
ncbi:MAG: glycerol-3-phosphate 1-O-acyltransferase PlsY [Candidatus Omnitrophica bacterium]|jgi:glycerol-3-phosphate acyltransferase PlsY|nr:glycerol-3-phosphate 1-O-acyltransferase PlsY [Candidatus Omnitrophota bacterium]MDD5661087.1 glycerol-3-phosphate 1-O-acyltransferase PlsY [Candidatus Omnitrophota bacterium]